MAHHRIRWRGAGRKNPSGPWERYAQKPLSHQITSTQYGPHLTSVLIAYDKRVGDYFLRVSTCLVVVPLP